MILLFSIIVISCGRHDTGKSLRDVDSLVASNPRMALHVIDSIENVADIDENGKMKLAWNRAVAHRALEMSLAEDTLLPKAIEYYRDKNENVGESYILEASYLCWTERTDKALDVIDKALETQNDTTQRLQLLMAKAEVYVRQNKHIRAAETLEEALRYNLPKREQAVINYRLGLHLSLAGDRRSEQYYDNGIRIALECGDTAIACEFMRNYANYLSNNGQYLRSNELLHNLCALMPGLAEMSVIQTSMAANYINLHRLDSARMCNERAIRSEKELEAHGNANMARRAILEQHRFLLDYESGKAVSSTDFARFCDSVMNDMITKENTSTRRLETKNRLLSTNYELQLDKNRLVWMLTIALLLIVCGIVAAYLHHRNRIHRLAEAEDRIDTLTRMLETAVADNSIGDTELATDLSAKEAGTIVSPPAEDSITESNLPGTADKAEDDAFFKKVLLQQLGIIRLMASTPTNQNQTLLKRISAISGGEIPTGSLLVWGDLYSVIDRLYDHFHYRLSAGYGNVLTEKEIQICCLLRAGFTTKEIGVVTQQTNATIYVRKTSIRKKIGAGEGQDIVEFMNRHI